MGEVYRARDQALGRLVAVKVLNQEDEPSLRERLRREARILGSLGSPHVVSAIDVGTDDRGAPFFVMELLKGRPLGAILEDGPLEPRRAAKLAIQVLEALTAAHAAGIIHRDLKPDNIFIVTSPALGEVAKVLDFGIAKRIVGHGALTDAGALIGTVHYMSPEQAVGGDVDPRTDLYSLGVCLYRACSGAFPHDAENAFDLIELITTAPIQKLHERAPVDRAFSEIVHRALWRDRDGRFATAEAMSRAIATYLSGAAAVDPVGLATEVVGDTVSDNRVAPPVAPAAPPERTSRVTLMVAVAVLFAGIGFLSWALLRARSGPDRTAIPSVPSVPPTVEPLVSSADRMVTSAASALTRQPPRGPAAQATPSARSTSSSSTACPSTDLVCNGHCVQQGVDNCGSCGHACRDDEQCTGAAATRSCQSCRELARGSIYGQCEGPHSCFDLAISPVHCGACGHACQSTERCFQGTCVHAPKIYEACSAQTCSSPHTSCHGGRCACDAPFQDCGEGVCLYRCLR